ncbi:MAG: hypothetical protein AAF202_03840, partial [Pseudomonadota bacterium]
LPNEVPKAMNLQHLPENILKSGAVNTLIQQNEDLLSRLSIHLRRYAKLEEDLEARDKEIHRLASNESHLKDQILIVERKAELIEDRTSDTRTDNENLRRDVQLLETRYSELYARSKEQIENLRIEKETYRKKSERLARYRHRILRISSEIRSELSKARFNSQKLEAEYAVLSESFQALRQRMAASAEHIQAQEKIHQSNIASLTEEYETRLTNLERLSQEKSTRILALENEIGQIAELEETKIQVENQLILAQRKAADAKTDFETQIHEIQLKMRTFREEAKERTLENQQIIEERDELSQKLQTAQEKCEDLGNQVESLQVVWSKNNSSLEQEKDKNNSLQKLNQQVSLSLNEARQDIKRLKEAQETAKLKNADLIRSLESQIRNLIKKGQSEDPDTPREVDAESLKRIEGLIAEVQSGMTDC